jgi:hypothetical protein
MLLLLSKIEKEEDKKKKNRALLLSSLLFQTSTTSRVLTEQCFPPLPAAIPDVTDLKAGNIVKAKITSVLPTQLNVSLGSHIRGALLSLSLSLSSPLARMNMHR